MPGRARRHAWGAASLAALGLAATLGARSTGIRTSVAAAYRAFRDPSLLDPRPQLLPAPGLLTCPRAEAPANVTSSRALDLTPASDRDLARDLARDLDRDLDGDDALTRLAMPDLRVPLTPRTRRFIHILARTEGGRASFLQRYRRAGAYREIIEGALREAGLPESLLWLAAVESGFDPRAVSPKGAAGLFQFMPETGRAYGLEQSPWVDERRSIARASAAAARHLRDLHERLGRWDLALAAYNAGYERIAVALTESTRARQAEGGLQPTRDLTFADLEAEGRLPAETADYVPQIMAFAILAENRARFDLDGQGRDEEADPLDPAEISVPPGTRLSTLARAAGVSTRVLRAYNPQLLRDRAPSHGGDYLLALPADRVAHTLAALPAYLAQERAEDADLVPSTDPDLASELRQAPLFAMDSMGDNLASAAEQDLDLDAEDPLPRRPLAFGRNPLPALPPQVTLLFAAPPSPLNVSDASFALAGHLSPAALTAGVGWQRPPRLDLLGALGGHLGEALARAQIAPLSGPTASPSGPRAALSAVAAPIEMLSSFTLPNGVEIRLRRDVSAAAVTLTARVASAPPAALPRLAATSLVGGAAERLFTLTVAPADLPAAVEIAAARLRLTLDDETAAASTAARRRAGAAHRDALRGLPEGAAWITLSDALFPAGHPLEGTILGAAAPTGAARDLLLATALERERAHAKVTLTLAGALDELRARTLAEASLGPLPALDEAPRWPHPREDRFALEAVLPAPRALYGFLGPAAEGEGGPALRLATALLDARLLRTLEDPRAAVPARATLHEVGRVAAAVLELTPPAGLSLEDAEARLEAVLETLTREPPSVAELANARAGLEAALGREAFEKPVAPSPTPNGPPRAATPAELRRALFPSGRQAELAGLAAVIPDGVLRVAGQVFSREHRVVVTVTPPARSAPTAP